MDTNLVSILKEEHLIIRGIFDEIDTASDLENKKIFIRKLQSVLAPHLKKEDSELYPTLERSPDEEVRRMANVFSSTMGVYAGDFAIVASKMLSISSGGASQDLLADYENIRDRIKDRITIEEVTIFPAYEKSI